MKQPPEWEARFVAQDCKLHIIIRDPDDTLFNVASCGESIDFDETPCFINSPTGGVVEFRDLCGECFTEAGRGRKCYD